MHESWTFFYQLQCTERPSFASSSFLLSSSFSACCCSLFLCIIRFALFLLSRLSFLNTAGVFILSLDTARTHCRHQDFFQRLADVLEKALEPLYYKAEQEKKSKSESTGKEGNKEEINASIKSSHPLSAGNHQNTAMASTSMTRKNTRSEEKVEKETREGETVSDRSLSSVSCPPSSSFSSSSSPSLLKSTSSSSSSSSTRELPHKDDVVLPEGLTFGVLAVGLRGMVNCGFLPSDRLFTYASELLQQYVEDPSVSSNKETL